MYAVQRMQQLEPFMIASPVRLSRVECVFSTCLGRSNFITLKELSVAVLVVHFQVFNFMYFKQWILNDDIFGHVAVNHAFPLSFPDLTFSATRPSPRLKTPSSKKAVKNFPLVHLHGVRITLVSKPVNSQSLIVPGINNCPYEQIQNTKCRILKYVLYKVGLQSWPFLLCWEICKYFQDCETISQGEEPQNTEWKLQNWNDGTSHHLSVCRYEPTFPICLIYIRVQLTVISIFFENKSSVMSQTECSRLVVTWTAFSNKSLCIVLENMIFVLDLIHTLLVFFRVLYRILKSKNFPHNICLIHRGSRPEAKTDRSD